MQFDAEKARVADAADMLDHVRIFGMHRGQKGIIRSLRISFDQVRMASNWAGRVAMEQMTLLSIFALSMDLSSAERVPSNCAVTLPCLLQKGDAARRQLVRKDMGMEIDIHCSVRNCG